jgi:hypothetical protein
VITRVIHPFHNSYFSDSVVGITLGPATRWADSHGKNFGVGADLRDIVQGLLKRPRASATADLEMPMPSIMGSRIDLLHRRDSTQSAGSTENEGWCLPMKKAALWLS